MHHFWGSSSYADHIFLVQKQTIRTMLNINFMSTCSGWFKSDNISTLRGLCIKRITLTFQSTVTSKWLSDNEKLSTSRTDLDLEVDTSEVQFVKLQNHKKCA